MNLRRPTNSTAVALWVVAALLLANLLATLSRPGLPAFLPVAAAQQQGQQARQAPIAGGAGLFVMPAQLSGNTWGAYLMDVDRGTLAVYQYLPSNRQLQLVAARYIGNDRNLRNFNTAAPSPNEVAELVEKENVPLRQPPPQN